MQEITETVSLINSNMNLKLWANRSTQIGIGTVQNVFCKFDDINAIYTYAEILVGAPITDKVEPEQTVLVKYLGGEIGDQGCIVFRDWPYFANDTITPPEVFKLEKRMTVLFFANDTTNALLGYIPCSTAKPVQQSPELLMSEPLPTTHVDENEGFGFQWLGQYLDWNDMPWEYNIDPDGTADIAGTTDEFNAIHEAHSAWENAPYCGVDFVFGGTSTNYTCYNNASGRDYVNNVHWELDFPNSNVAENILKYSGHTLENDIVFNDENYHWLIGSGFWSWEYDLQAVATHEVGHTLGLTNLEEESNSAQTMYCGSRDTSRRTLEWGDLNGAHYLYPEHNDAGSGGDAGDSFNDATYFTTLGLIGRLCRLPGDIDGNDYYKFYATANTVKSFILYVPGNADFDLELYNPSGNLVAYSRYSGDGATESIYSQTLTTSGFWRIRIYNATNNARQCNGKYQFVTYDFTTKYVSSIAWSGTISGSGGVSSATNMIGSSPDGNFAGIYGYNAGDAAAIIGYMNEQVPSGGSDIYIYGYTMNGDDARVYVYVSQNNNYDWNYVNDLVIDVGSPDTIHLGYTTFQFRYIGISIYIEDEDQGSGLLIDCLIVTT